MIPQTLLLLKLLLSVAFGVPVFSRIISDPFIGCVTYLDEVELDSSSCYLTNNFKICCLKQDLLSHMVLVGQGLSSGLTGWFWLKFFHEVSGVTWGCSHLKFASGCRVFFWGHSHGCKLVPALGKVFISSPNGPLNRLFECQTWQLTSSRVI